MKHSFKESYDVLQRHAAALRNQSEPNIDDLLRIVEESVAAYKICQTRIDAVEKALDKALSQVEPGGERAAQEPGNNANNAGKPASSTTTRTPATAQPASTSGASGFDDMDDDIPF
jgi:exodeoxyribonuclease VII small subunit